MIVETIYLDADDCQVVTQLTPCDCIETARKVVELTYEEIVKHYLDSTDDKDEWEKRCVRRRDNGSIYIEGYEGGFAKINIIETDEINSENISSFKPKFKRF